MNEREDEWLIHIGEEEFLMNRTNAKLYTFFGHLATRNHVFLITGEEREDVTIGTYVFAHSEAYAVLCQFMVQHAYPMNLNGIEVAECDENAFQRSMEQIEASGGSMVDDYLPEDWLGND